MPVSHDTSDHITEVEPEMARRCPVWETIFTVIYPFSRQVFCSPTCKAANRNSKPAQQTCPICENEFTTTVGRRRTYCSEVPTATSRSPSSRFSRPPIPPALPSPPPAPTSSPGKDSLTVAH